ALAGFEHGVEVFPAGDREIVAVEFQLLGGIPGAEASGRGVGRGPAAVEQDGLQVGLAHCTGFSRTRPSISMRTTSPDCRVKDSSGTMPVPVNRKAPNGNDSSRNR